MVGVSRSCGVGVVQTGMEFRAYPFPGPNWDKASSGIRRKEDVAAETVDVQMAVN